MHPCEQREGNPTKRILTIGRRGNEDRGKLRRKLEALCLPLKYEPFFSPVNWRVILTPLTTHGEVEEGDFCAATPAAFEGQVTDVAVWVSTLKCIC